MSGEVVGIVTDEEKDQIMSAFERKLGLNELMYTFESGLLSSEEIEDMKEKIKIELERTETSVKNWWDSMYEKYQWKSVDKCQWSIDFQTCEIYLAG